MEHRHAGQLIAGALILIAFGLWLVPTGIRDQWRHSKLQKHGLVTEGSIVGRFVGKSSGKSSAKEYHVVDVKFLPEGGQRTTVSLRVSNDFFSSHTDPATSKIEVRYLPADPTIAAIEGEPGPGIGGWLLGLVAILIGVFMGWGGLRALA